MLNYPLIDRYILGKYLRAFLLWFAIIFVIVITFDVSEKLDDFLKNEAPLGEIIFQYYLNFIPNFFNLYGPLFVFISTLFFTSKLAGNTEVIAILSSGISYKRFLRPYLHGAIILALGILVIGNFIIPVSNVRLNDFESRYIHTHKRSYYSDLHFQSSRGIHISTVSYDVNEMSAIIFQQDSYNDNGILTDRIRADKLTYDTASNSWKAIDYRHRTFDGDRETYVRENFQTLNLDLVPADFDKADRNGLLVISQRFRIVADYVWGKTSPLKNDEDFDYRCAARVQKKAEDRPCSRTVFRCA